MRSVTRAGSVLRSIVTRCCYSGFYGAYSSGQRTKCCFSLQFWSGEVFSRYGWGLDKAVYMEVWLVWSWACLSS